MMKMVLYAAMMLAPVFCFAENFCEICGRNISLAKNSRRCAGCAVAETVGVFADMCKYPDKNLRQVQADRRTRRLGEYAMWNFVCVDHRFPFKVVDSSGEHRLDYCAVLAVRENPARIRIVLKEAVDTYIIHENRKIEKHCGIYVLDNVPICLPKKNRMTLLVHRCAVKTIEYALIAEGDDGRRVCKIGTVQAGGREDLSDVY